MLPSFSNFKSHVKERIDSKSKIFKDTVNLILSDPLLKEGLLRFTKLPLKALSDQELIRYPCL